MIMGKKTLIVMNTATTVFAIINSVQAFGDNNLSGGMGWGVVTILVIGKLIRE